MVFIGKLYLTDETIKIHNGSSAAPGESVKYISKGYNRSFFKNQYLWNAAIASISVSLNIHAD